MPPELLSMAAFQLMPRKIPVRGLPQQRSAFNWPTRGKETAVFKDVISCLLTKIARTTVPQPSQEESVKTGRNIINCSEERVNLNRTCKWLR